MTPLEELRAGSLGEAFVTLLYRQVAVVARRRRFPPPGGYGSWDADAVVETAHEFLVHRDTFRRLVELAARVEDEAGLERVLTVVVTNFLRERGRRTVLGKLIRRLRGLLADDPRFVVVPAGVPGAGNVALAGASTVPYADDPARLVDAARSVREVTVVRWSPSARREGPVADAPSLLALSFAVLETAGGSLSFADLAEVIATRLGIDPRGVPGALAVEDIDDLAARDLPSASTSGASDEAVGQGFEVEEIAAAVLEEFSDREKLVLAWLGETVRSIADRTGLAVSTAGAVSQRVRDKLLARLADLDDDSRERVAVAVRDAARVEVGGDQW